MRFCLIIFSLVLAFASPALAHFGMIIPSSSTVMDKAEADLALQISFSHPFARQGMDMAVPEKFGVYQDGKYTDLLSTLREEKIMGSAAFRANYKIARPGVYSFAVEPKPYFEPAEDCFIIHYAKTVVGAFGAEDGWEKPLGLKIEIVPKLRPFANYAGNVFVGQALLDGKPLANAVVEVEALNRGNAHGAPNGYFETQTLYCDENGIFAFGIPWAGWWGFAVLAEGSETMKHEGAEKAVELGATLWLEFVEPKKEKKQAAKQDGSLWKE